MSAAADLLERLDLLIAAIHAAGSDLGSWHSVVARIGDVLGGEGAALVVAAPDRAIRTIGSGALAGAQITLHPGQGGRTALFAPSSRCVESHVLTVSAPIPSQGEVGLIVLRPDAADGFGPNEHALFHEIFGHVLTRLDLSARLSQAERSLEHRDIIFDRLGLGLFLLDRAGTILRSNAQAKATLKSGRWLARHGRGLRAVDGPGSMALAKLLDAPDRDLVGAEGVAYATAVLRSGDTPPLAVCVVHFLTARNHPPNAPHRALLTAEILDRDIVADPALAAVYGLTPAEGRALRIIALGVGTAEAARLLGVGEATVKTHLQGIFAKTGTRSQTDLVRLVAAWTAPTAWPASPDADGRSDPRD